MSKTGNTRFANYLARNNIKKKTGAEYEKKALRQALRHMHNLERQAKKLEIERNYAANNTRVKTEAALAAWHHNHAGNINNNFKTYFIRELNRVTQARGAAWKNPRRGLTGLYRKLKGEATVNNRLANVARQRAKLAAEKAAKLRKVNMKKFGNNARARLTAARLRSGNALVERRRAQERIRELRQRILGLTDEANVRSHLAAAQRAAAEELEYHMPVTGQRVGGGAVVLNTAGPRVANPAYMQRLANNLRRSLGLPPLRANSVGSSTRSGNSSVGSSTRSGSGSGPNRNGSVRGPNTNPNNATRNNNSAHRLPRAPSHANSGRSTNSAHPLPRPGTPNLEQELANMEALARLSRANSGNLSRLSGLSGASSVSATSSIRRNMNQANAALRQAQAALQRRNNNNSNNEEFYNALSQNNLNEIEKLKVNNLNEETKKLIAIIVKNQNKNGPKSTQFLNALQKLKTKGVLTGGRKGRLIEVAASHNAPPPLPPAPKKGWFSRFR